MSGGASALPSNLKNMKRDYQIIEAKTAAELEQLVREMLLQKYRPCGGVAVKGTKLLQAVER